MNVLGLDMSSKKTGYSLFSNNQLIDYGCWELSSDDEKDWRKRIMFMADMVNDYCKKHKIEKVLIEDVPPIMSTQNVQTVKILSALQGCVVAILHLRKIDFEFISVSTWKKKIGIDLTHSKEFNSYKRQYKDDKNLTKFKALVKAYEKKLSVDLANSTFGLELKYVSPLSKKNDDDISDCINIVTSKLLNVKYDMKSFEDIMKDLWIAVQQKGVLKNG